LLASNPLPVRAKCENAAGDLERAQHSAARPIVNRDSGITGPGYRDPFSPGTDSHLGRLAGVSGNGSACRTGTLFVKEHDPAITCRHDQTLTIGQVGRLVELDETVARPYVCDQREVTLAGNVPEVQTRFAIGGHQRLAVGAERERTDAVGGQSNPGHQMDV